MGSTPDIRTLLDLVNQHFERVEQPRARGASADELKLLRQALGFELPQQLMHWLSQCRGGYVEAGSVVHLLGTDRNFSILDGREGVSHLNQPRWVPVADDGCGDYFCLVCGENAAAAAPVIFVDHETDESYLVGSSLFKFLEIVLSEPPCDEDEERKSAYFDRERFFAIDPDAAKVRGFAYGWEN